MNSRATLILSLALAACSGGGSHGPPPPPRDFSGQWAGAWTSDSHPGQWGNLVADIAQSATVLHGDVGMSNSGCCGGGPFTGDASGDRATLVETGCGFQIAVQLEMSDDGMSLSGYYEVGAGGGQCAGDHGRVGLTFQ